jgi:acyl-CoA hydrolase
MTRVITADEAAALVRDGMWLDFGGGIIQPRKFDAALARRVPTLGDIKIRTCLSMRPVQAAEADPAGERVYCLGWHYSSLDRKLGDAGRASYVPVHLGEIPGYYRENLKPADIMVIRARPADGDGSFNVSTINLWLAEAIAHAKCVIIETAPGFPHAEGEGVSIPASQVDYVIEGDDAPPYELPNAPATDIDRTVARLISAEIGDGACLQIGIGGMPNAVCAALADSGIRDLGVHTEMLTDGIIDLYHAGLVTGARKQLHPGKIVYSFALGSQRLYDAIDRNPDMLSLPVDRTNQPHVIMQNDNMVSINNTTQIDLQGQCASESDGHRHISGTGGQAQFVRGAYASKGGKSFMCLSSTYTKRGAPRSRIVLELTPGNVVTTHRSDTQYVVTEYGMVNLKGKSVAERAKALISIAHPDFREDLERLAFERRIIPRGFSF